MLTNRYKPKDPFSNAQLFKDRERLEFRGLLIGAIGLVLLYLWVCTYMAVTP